MVVFRFLSPGDLLSLPLSILCLPQQHLRRILPSASASHQQLPPNTMSTTATTTTTVNATHKANGDANGHVKPATLTVGGGEPAKSKSNTNTYKANLATNPFERVWRGNREGTIRMTAVPTFTDKYEERKWIKEHMAGAFRMWGKLGFGEGTAGHITVRDPVMPDHYWMVRLELEYCVRTLR